MSTTFGERIRIARVLRDLTLEEVGNAIDCKKGYLSGIESGKMNPPRPPTVKAIAKYFGLNPEFLLALAHAEKAPEEVRDLFLEFVEDKFVPKQEIAKEA